MHVLVQVLKVTAAVLGGLLLFALVAAGLLVGTETGTRVVLRALAPVLPDGIDIGSPTGRLLGPLALRDVRVETETLVLTASRVTVHWAPSRLIRGQLDVLELTADGVRYQGRPPLDEPDAGDGLALPARIDLPVGVTIRRLRVDDIELLVSADQDEPLVLEQILLAGRFADARLVLESLEARGPGLEVRGHVDLVAADDYPLAAQMSTRYQLPDYAPIEGVTELAGTLASLRFRQEIGAPYHLSLSGTITQLLAADATPVLAAALIVDDLRLMAVSVELPDAALSLSARVAGPLDRLEIAADMAGMDPEQRRFEAELAARFEPEGIALERLTVTQPGRPGVLRGEGRIALDGDLAAELEVAWESLQWPLAGAPTLESPRGRLRLTGPADDYAFEVHARVEPLDQPPLDVQLTGDGSREAVTARLDVEVASGRLGGRVAVAWSPDLEASARLEGNGIDPSMFAEDWPGAVDFLLDGDVAIADERFNVRLSTLEADGRLRGETLMLRGEGELARHGEAYRATIERFDLSLGSTRASASGRVDDRVDVSWDVSSDDLAELLPDVRGRLDGAGTVTGAYPDLRFGADLRGRRLAFGEFVLDDLQARADVDLAGRRQSSFEITATDGSVGEFAVQRLVLEADGVPGDHRVRLTVAADEAQAAARVTGHFDAPWNETRRWHFVLSDAHLGYGGLPPWRLDGTATGLVSPDRVRIDRHCWGAAGADLCLDAHMGSEQSQGLEVLTANIELASLTVDHFAALMPDGLQATGALNGSLRVERSSAGVLTGELDLATTAGRIVLPEVDEAGIVGVGMLPVVRFEPSWMRLVLDPDDVRVTAAVNLQHGRLGIDAATAAAVVTGPEDPGDPSLAERPLTGALEIDIPDLAFLDQFLPAVARPEGSIAGRLQLSGTLGEPISTGSLRLRDGAATLTEPRVRVEDLTVTLEGRERDGFALEALAASGGGRLSATGVLQLFGEAPVAEIAIEGTDFEILNTDDARIFASPSLRIEASAERVAVSGVVRVPRAQITPGRRTAGAVTVSPDQVLVGEEPEVDVAPRELYAEIRLIPGDEVFFSGFGLDARIEGDLRLIEAPGVPTWATGELQIVDGEYRAYGQGLVIQRGRIFFAGPITEPAVDIEAVRRPREGILVGARVQGTLDEPEFSLFSDPTMPEQEQLAYLVLGRPLDEAPGGEGSALAQAALALGLRGGDALAQNIGDRLGVDEFAIVTGPGEAGAETDPTQAALVVGTYLSPRLYVSYGIGLFQPGSVLQLQYDISRRWRLVTRSGADATGADLLFTLERGRK
jgi:translocation and assembly module TamB